MATQFDPPDSHWAADFDQRLNSSLEYLRERLDFDRGLHQQHLAEMRSLHAEMQQMVADCKTLLDEARK